MWNGDALYMVDSATRKLYTVNLTNGTATEETTVKALQFDGVQIYGGLVWDGADMYIVDKQIDLLYVLDTQSGKARMKKEVLDVDRSLAPFGMAWDGTQIYMADRHNDALYTIDREEGKATRVNRQVQEFSAGIKEPSGIAWAGNELYMVAGKSLYKVNKTTGSASVVKGAEDIGIQNPQGMTWDGSNLYVVDSEKDALFKITGLSAASPPQTVPANLRITPLPLRQALLSWDFSAGASGYIVECRPSTQSDWDRYAAGEGCVQVTTNTNRGFTPSKYVRLRLDNLLTKNPAYDFQVKAIGGSESEYVTVTDNPVVRADGDSRSASGGRATLEWLPISGVSASDYTVTYRQLTLSNLDYVEPVQPGVSGWPSGFGATQTTPAPKIEEMPDGSKRLRLILGGLSTNQIYAVRVNYRKTTGSVERTVYSARDVYVWPSKTQPLGEDTRVATYPFFGHHKNREYRYVVCDETFTLPSNLATAHPNFNSGWEQVIDASFKQWETATDGLVTTINEGDIDCKKLSIFETLLWEDIEQIKQNVDDERSEVRMIPGNRGEIFASAELATDIYKICLLFSHACVTSRAGYSVDQRATNILPGVDVTFDKSTFTKLNTQTNTLQHPPDLPSVDFNACSGSSTYAYKTALHEAGHALGLSALSIDESDIRSIRNWNPRGWYNLVKYAFTDYQVSHPTIPTSVMNYNSRIDDFQSVPPGYRESDCYPHPLDIMAVYALYQTVEKTK